MPNIHQALLISTPAETVYQAITTQDGLSGWWTPDVTASPKLNNIARFHFGPEYFKEMKIIELEPCKQVTWNCMKGAEEWVGTTLRFKLEAAAKEALPHVHPELKDQAQQAKGGTQTLLILQHEDWKDYTLMFAECSYTWGRFLRSLKSLCETGKGRPWPHQHGTWT